MQKRRPQLCKTARNPAAASSGPAALELGFRSSMPARSFLASSLDPFDYVRQGESGS